MNKAYVGHEFEALKLRYEDQVALLRFLTDLDFKIFTTFFTLQLLLGSFIATQDKISQSVAVGLAIIDIAMAVLSVKLLFNNHLRRQQVASTIDNLNTALGFKELGVYRSGKTLNPEYPRHYWFPWYAIGVLVSVAGVLIALFGRGDA
jgi:hypothetical protein